MKEQIKILLKSKTFSMFSPEFYELISDEIDSIYLSGSDMGYVYVISNGYSGNYKIGMAKDLLSRVASYSTSFENGVILHAFVKCDNYIQMERKLHQKFKEKRIRGEFFRLEYSDINSLTDYNFSFVNPEYKKVGNIINMINNVTENFSDSEIENSPLFKIPLGDKIYNTFLHTLFDSSVSKKAIKMECQTFAQKMGYTISLSSDAKGRFIIFRKTTN